MLEALLLKLRDLAPGSDSPDVAVLNPGGAEVYATFSLSTRAQEDAAVRRGPSRDSFRGLGGESGHHAVSSMAAHTASQNVL